MSKLEIIEGSIIGLKVDCVVNAANSQLLQGGGVCGVIFRAAGSRELQNACNDIGYCGEGQAVITSGFKLCPYIIHTVGPRFNPENKKINDALLYDSYRGSLDLARQNHIHSIVFPLISAGIFGYPSDISWSKGIRASLNFMSKYPDYDMDIYFVNNNQQTVLEGRKIYINKYLSSLSKEKIEVATSLKDRNADLEDRFVDTIYHFISNNHLNDDIQRLRDHSIVYKENYQSDSRVVKCSEGNNITVVEDTTYHHASKYIGNGNKVAVLNFANAKHPGGGVLHGTVAQEEALCRSSNLYLSLLQDSLYKDYYYYHKDHPHRYSDRLIYSSEVTVIKEDEYPYNSLLQPFKVDVITCAAPRDPAKNGIEEEELKQIHYTRGKNILEAAMSNHVDILILGAFGCGAFSNPPEVVANVYLDLLQKDGYAKYFKKVIFAIKGSKKGDTNYQVFSKVFHSMNTETIEEENTYLIREYDWNDCFSYTHPNQFTVEGVVYTSLVQYLMAKVALIEKNMNKYLSIMEEMNPKNIYISFDRHIITDEIIEEILTNACYCKFAHNPSLKTALLSTKNKVIVNENNQTTLLTKVLNKIKNQIK